MWSDNNNIACQLQSHTTCKKFSNDINRDAPSTTSIGTVGAVLNLYVSFWQCAQPDKIIESKPHVLHRTSQWDSLSHENKCCLSANSVCAKLDWNGKTNLFNCHSPHRVQTKKQLTCQQLEMTLTLLQLTLMSNWGIFVLKQHFCTMKKMQTHASC